MSNRFKVSDEVVIRGKITEIDEDAPSVPYKVQYSDGSYEWFSDSDLSPAEPVKEKTFEDLNVGEVVYDNRGKEHGISTVYDRSYRLNDLGYTWTAQALKDSHFTLQPSPPQIIEHQGRKYKLMEEAK